MKKIKLAMGTWLTVDKVKHEPGSTIEIYDDVADSLIASGSAVLVEEVKKNAIKESSNSSKD